MSGPDPTDEAPQPESPPTAPCRFLRNKGMYVYSDGSGGGHEDYDNTIYWCLQTQKSFGPDDDYVSGEECRNPSRTCYEAL